jgi:hypothetical protein
MHVQCMVWILTWNLVVVAIGTSCTQRKSACTYLNTATLCVSSVEVETFVLHTCKDGIHVHKGMLALA